MLSTRALSCRIFGASRGIRPMVRFQSVASDVSHNYSQSVKVQTPSHKGQEQTLEQQSKQASKQASKQGAQSQTHKEASKEASNGMPQKFQSSKPKRRPTNRKVLDITAQINSSLDAANGSDIVESVDILEEGITYLREVQGAERITDEVLFFAFQPAAAKAMDKVVKAREEGVDLGAKSPSALLDMLVENKIAHKYHFSCVQKHILRQSSDVAAYGEALQVWVKYLEYRRSLATSSVPFISSLPFCLYERSHYKNRDLLQMTYFSLAMQFLKTNTPFELEAVMKVLQVDDVSLVPEGFHVLSTIRRSGLEQALSEDVGLFKNKLQEMSIDLMDPNSHSVARRIGAAVKQNNVRRLDQLFAEMKAASVRNSVPISETTLNKIMASYITCKSFDSALQIFSYMLAGAIKKPSSSSWELALKAMGHPSNVSGMSDKEKAEAVVNIESVVRTMVANGVPVNARSLGIIVGALSCLNRQDLVKQYLKTYENVPVVHMARDNILIGMALNRDIVAAEDCMKQFLAEDSSYKPSTNVMNSFLTFHVSAGNDKAVEGILNFMKQHGIEESVSTTTTILNYYFKSFRKRGLVPNMNDLFQELSKDTSKWDSHMVSMLMDGLCKDGLNLDAARAVFKFFCENNSRLKQSEGMLTSMIKAELDYGSVHNAGDLFDWMIKHVRNDTRMWNMMIAGLLAKRESLALDYYQRLLQQAPFNVKPNYFTYYFLLKHFERKGHGSQLQALLDDLSAQEMQDFGNTLPELVRSLARDYRVDPELIKRMKVIRAGEN